MCFAAHPAAGTQLAQLGSPPSANALELSRPGGSLRPSPESPPQTVGPPTQPFFGVSPVGCSHTRARAQVVNNPSRPASAKRLGYLWRSHKCASTHTLSRRQIRVGRGYGPPVAEHLKRLSRPQYPPVAEPGHRCYSYYTPYWARPVARQKPQRVLRPAAAWGATPDLHSFAGVQVWWVLRRKLAGRARAHSFGGRLSPWAGDWLMPCASTDHTR